MNTARVPRRPLLGLAIAAVTGLAGAAVDTSRGFDDTGVLVAGLVLGAAIAALAAGRTGWGWLVLLVLAVGLPVPVAEALAGGQLAAFAAIVFAAAGVAVGGAAARLGVPEPASRS
jgi:hypothetical protein